MTGERRYGGPLPGSPGRSLWERCEAAPAEEMQCLEQMMCSCPLRLSDRGEDGWGAGGAPR